MWVMIIPDALNHLTVYSELPLRKPDKILRWMTEVTGRILSRWCFGPGPVNRVADFCSRNTRDRDELRPPEDDTDPYANKPVPKTLRQAFEMVSADMVDRDLYFRGAPWKPARYRPPKVQAIAHQYQFRTLSGRR